ncbi:hypothetical protein L3X38_042330 [Prunus dulcis]|uniref:Uncharacterized protein n=1 Tax=Prunus dulcis TaxID=3755 RepID=A0AAD4UWD9_PRUDU|nr:hypothetical protein L3X38_042330 [Prunus dulcis]
MGTIDLDIYSLPVVSSQTFMVMNEVSPTTESWADNGSARSMLSHPFHTKRSATSSLGVESGISTVIKPWKEDAQPKGSRRASSYSSHR